MKISVCMATYNGEKFIQQQIDSILEQLSDRDELIISDDGSTDSTISIIKKYDDKRVFLYTNSGINGVAHNFENALRHASGDFIFLSDQDDIWEADKVSTLVKELANYDCVLHNAYLIDAAGDFLENDLFSIYKSRKGYIKNLFRNTFVGCCMAFKKELLKNILPIPKEITMHDMWIALIAEKKGETKLISDKLIQYRRHDNNASTTSNKTKFSKYYQLKYRLIMLYYTTLRN